LSEARLLKKEDVDFDKGVLTILESKGRKSRLVYLPPDGITVLSDYLTQIEKELPGSPWLFPGRFADKPLLGSSINRRFKDCWNRLPFADKTDKCPTIHCLRHAFVVERMNDWMQSGVDLQEMLPYLSNYLGHKTPSETFYYYHLVNKAFAIVKEKDKVSDRVIPEVLLYED
jgi:integrase